ncbi:MAG: hypothetical protein QW403_03200 [Candidatus Aenigmatarchaeota archaeon]
MKVIGDNYYIVEENHHFITEEDIKNEKYKGSKKLKIGPFFIVTEDGYKGLRKIGKKPRFVTQFTKSLYKELNLSSSYNSLEEIISEIGRKDISPKNVEERNKLLYKLILEKSLQVWRKAFGIFPILYDSEHSYQIFSFLTNMLEKKGLFETFSLITEKGSLLHDKLDFKNRQNAYILNERYRLINLSENEERKIVWVPNNFDSFFTFNRNLKRILEMEKAPRELLKITEMWENFLFEERRKREELELKFALRSD